MSKKANLGAPVSPHAARLRCARLHNGYGQPIDMRLRTDIECCHFHELAFRAEGEAGMPLEEEFIWRCWRSA